MSFEDDYAAENARRWQLALKRRRKAEKRLRRAVEPMEMRTAAVALAEAEAQVETRRSDYEHGPQVT